MSAKPPLSNVPAPTLLPEEALAFWDAPGAASPVAHPGLINRTFEVSGEVGEPPRAILQWLNPIFDPTIHLDVEALTRRLEAAGLLTPRLVPSRDGHLWVDDEVGVWRMQTYVEGQTLHRLDGPAQAAAGGALIGRFHAVLSDWRYELVAPRRAIHDTPTRMAALRAALGSCDGHPLAEPAREVGAAVLHDWDAWDGELDLPERVCHGDLKVSNVRFSGDGRQALCLIDLDTVEPMAYACEMGDAWRSWCNPAPEDEPEAVRFDVPIFAAAAAAWLANAPSLAADERRSLVPGIERICLELASRFTADAVMNSYFREDRDRYPEPGAQNLLRARGQLALARAARAARSACEDALTSAPCH